MKSNAKYIGANPYIDLMYKKPSTKKMNFKPTITNGHFSGLIYVTEKGVKKQYVLQNSAQYNAIFNIAMNGYFNYNGFNKYCKDSRQEEFFDALCSYGDNGNMKSYENKRFLILRKIAQGDGNIDNDIITRDG